LPSSNEGGASQRSATNSSDASRARPLGVGQRAEVQVVEGQQVEDQIRDGQRARQSSRAGRVADVHALGQRPERGTAVLVEDGDLAVEHRGAPAEGVGQPGKLRIGDGDLGSAPGEKPDLAGRDGRDRAHPVPFQLIRPSAADR
jgi:hypothetical protein